MAHGAWRTHGNRLLQRTVPPCRTATESLRCLPRSGRHLRTQRPIVPLLQQLHDAGLRLVLLSNTSITHIEFIERNFHVLKYMHQRVTSFSVGAMKPDHRIFKAALEAAQCPPEECFYTDDIEAYTSEARKLGIQSHTFTTVDLLTDRLRDLKIL